METNLTLSSGLVDVKTSQGPFFGTKHVSEDGRYSAVSEGGYFQDEYFVSGRVCLFGPEGELFITHDVIRPKRLAVSNNGTTVIGDWFHVSDALKSRVMVYSRTGELLFGKKFDRNCTQVGISPEGNIAVVGTANPGSCVRVIDVASAKIIKKIDGWLFGSIHVDEQERTITDMQHDGAVFKFSW